MGFQVAVESPWSYRTMYSLLPLLLIAKVISSQTLVVSYTSKTSETLPCSLSQDTLIATWRDDTVAADLYSYNVNSPSVETREPEAKHDNFNYSLTPNSDFSLIISDVEAEDEGDYQCSETALSTAVTRYTLRVEVPGIVSIKNGSQDVDELTVVVGESYEVTCSATGTRSDNELSLRWYPELEGGNLDKQTVDGLTDYTITSTYAPEKEHTSIQCQLTGYVTQSEIQTRIVDTVSLIALYKPECFLMVNTINANCRIALLTCDCTAKPQQIKKYSFYNGGSLINDTVSNTTIVDVDYDTTSEFSCRASSNIGTGGMSNKEKHSCKEGTTTKTTLDITTAGTLPNTDASIIDQCACNCTGLIAACSIEALLIALSVLINLLLITRGRKENQSDDTSGCKKEINRSDGTENRAYMDLQELGNDKHCSAETLQIPEKNVKIYSVLPGNGCMLQYHKGLVTRATGTQDAVVKTLSAEATLSMNKIFRSETQHNLKLQNGSNVAKLLGWCDTVPNYSLFEHINGGNLLNHLKEEFNHQKEHTYDNAKKKRFTVSEKGNIETLPKYALQVAKGIAFLTKNKFVHPGLRAKKVLLDTTGRCKLYDFVSMENANEWIQLRWIQSVPFQWMSPEFLFLESISSAGDVWSFGVLLWEIFNFGSQPYEGKTRSDVEKQLREREILSLPKNCPGAIWQLMLSCWESLVDKRSTIDAITAKLAPLCNEDKEYQEINLK